jgi:hypothetical protein
MIPTFHNALVGYTTDLYLGPFLPSGRATIQGDDGKLPAPSGAAGEGLA